MMKKTFFRLTAAIFFTMTWGGFLVHAAAGADLRTVVDPVGRSVRIPEVSRRVVTLAPSLTEMVFALGAGGRVVGVSRYSNYPRPCKVSPGWGPTCSRMWKKSSP